MKNKDTKCCGHKMNTANIFIGLLIGLAILIFGWKIYFQQNPMPEPQVLDQMKIDQAIEKTKAPKTTDVKGTWTSEGENPAKFSLNEDGTVSDMDGAKSWTQDADTITIMKDDNSTIILKLVDGNLVMGEVVYKK